MKSNEVELTQYLMPNGRQTIVHATVGEEHAKKAKGMILSTEMLMNGSVVVYGRWDWQDEEDEWCEIAVNGPGDNSPVNCLKKVIEHLSKIKK